MECVLWMLLSTQQVAVFMNITLVCTNTRELTLFTNMHTLLVSGFQTTSYQGVH